MEDFSFLFQYFTLFFHQGEAYEKLLVTICLTLSLSILYAGGIYATGGSVTKDSASKTVQGGLFFHDDNLIVDSRNENWINPLFSSHFDMVFSGLFNDHGLDQMGLSYIGGAGASFKPTSSLYINLSLGPSIFTTFGNKDGTFGLGLGGILSLSYAFSDPGFILMGGMEGSYTLLFDDSNPVMLGLFLGVGYKI